jgi:putative glutamine amidotransferase
MPKPLIGITTQRWSSSVAHPNTRVQGELDSYIDALLAAGGLPILIPLSVQGDDLRELYQRLDGLILPGGGDVDPDSYQAERHPATEGVDIERDQAELWLARQALADAKPLFGICRGLQVLNVASGGSLIQDIPSELPDAAAHYFSYPEYPLDYLAHSVQIEEDSLLAQCFEESIVQVNSRHHQAMHAVAPGLQIVARAPDGVVEAVEVPGLPYAMAVQWHPENLLTQPGMRALFERFVSATIKT